MIRKLLKSIKCYIIRTYIACLMYWTWAEFHGSIHRKTTWLSVHSVLYFLWKSHFNNILITILGDRRHGGYFSRIWTRLLPPCSNFFQKKRNNYYLLCNDPVWLLAALVKWGCYEVSSNNSFSFDKNGTTEATGVSNMSSVT